MTRLSSLVKKKYALLVIPDTVTVAVTGVSTGFVVGVVVIGTDAGTGVNPGADTGVNVTAGPHIC